MKKLRLTGRLCVLIAGALVVSAPVAFAASVTPTVVPGNPTCSDLNSGWSDFKPVDNNPSNGTYSDGTLSVTIANDSANGFDWSANHSVDAVIVKAGDQANVYTYDPESFGDTALATPDKQEISHVDFCYDEGDATPPLPPNGGGGGDNTDDGTNNTPAPAEQAPAPDSGQAPVDQPGEQAVLGERVVGGTARLFSASGCAAQPFSARVFGRGIARVVFVLDGNRVATLHRPSRNGSYSLRINPLRYRNGVHRLVVTIEFKPATRTTSRKLRASFQRCANRLIAPRFTG